MRIIAFGHSIRQVAPTEFALCLTVSLIAVLSIAQMIAPFPAMRASVISLAMAGLNDASASPADRIADRGPATPLRLGLISD